MLCINNTRYECNIDFTRPLPQGVTNLNEVPIQSVGGQSCIDDGSHVQSRQHSIGGVQVASHITSHVDKLDLNLI